MQDLDPSIPGADPVERDGHTCHESSGRAGAGHAGLARASGAGLARASGTPRGVDKAHETAIGPR